MSQTGSQGSCPQCGKELGPVHRRCPQCGTWVRPWSTGGKPATWSRYKVGGSGRPEDWGGEVGDPSDVVASVWVRSGPNKDRVQQSTPGGQAAPSGAHARRERERRERAARFRKRRSKS